MKKMKLTILFVLVISLLATSSISVLAASEPKTALDEIPQAASLDYRSNSILVNEQTGETLPVAVYRLPNNTRNAVSGSEAVQYMLALSGDSFSRSGTDNGYGMTAYLTVYFNRSTQDGLTYGQLTSVTGSWVVSDTSYKLSGRTVCYGEDGKSISGAHYSNSATKSPTTNSFSYTTSEMKQAINISASGVFSTFGCWSEVTITRKGSTWKLFLDCKY